MIKKLLACWLALALLCGFTKANPDPYDLNPVIDAFRFDGVEFDIEWKECGQVNAFYTYSSKKVTMCTELETLSPGVIRYILAHELSHAVIVQKDIAYTGSHEWAADELAALWLIVIGHSDDVMEGANFWFVGARRENPYDDHPGSLRRADNLACMVLTHDRVPGSAGCNTQYRRVISAWLKLLKLE